MDNALFNRTVELLQPHMRDKSDRKTLLDAALFGSPALNHIELTGTPFQFSSRLVNALDKYDSVKIVDVLEALKQNTGENNHPEIDNLIQEIAQLQPPSQRDLELAYLDSILEKYTHWLELYTPMAGVGQMRVKEETQTNIKIARTGVEMEIMFGDFLDERMAATQPQKIEERHYNNVLEALQKMRQLVILGEPGGGKSTTALRIMADYAERAQKDETAPIPVMLRMGQVRGEQSVEDYLKQELGNLGRFYETLLSDNRLLLLFDGLNELPREHRQQHAAQVKILIEQCQKNDMLAVVTCRALDYIKELDMGISEKLEIAPLDPLRIRQFVNAYITEPARKGDELFWTLAGDVALNTWQRFQQAVEVTEPEKVFWLADVLPGGKTWGWLNNNRYWENWLEERKHPRNMMTLARNPFMLFMLTQVFTRRGDIPQNRGQLFGWFADFMLKREKLTEQASIVLKTQLAKLAFEMQKQGEGTAFDVRTVQQYLAQDDVYVARSASILTEGESISFTHQLLQEYFAALHLDTERKKGVPASDFWQPENWWIPNDWNETAILMAGLYGDDCTEVITWLHDANPELTKRCILESGATVPDEQLEALRPYWLPRMTDLYSDPEAQARAAIGRVMANLSLDNRRGVGVNAGIPDIDWVRIPAGKFKYGDENEDDSPPQVIDLPDFYIARYPITYGQFQAFLDAEDGFDNSAWWEGMDEYKFHEMQNQSYAYANHPRDSVSWYQAVAFCHWLDTKLSKKGVKPNMNLQVRLPLETEWEKAARGTDGREYPYGNIFDATKAHMDETGIGQTSAVGIFPDDESPYSVLDMSGNVLEWCLNDYSNQQQYTIDESSRRRVLRGGTFIYGANYARCTFRHHLYPPACDPYVGFRVVCAPKKSL